MNSNVNAGDIRELSMDELNLVSGGDNVDVFRATLFGYGFALGLGDGVVCVTVITPDTDYIGCKGTGKPA